MINHIRTLLLNRSSAQIDTAALGHEFVPPDFRQVALPQELTRVRSVLFGSNPDSVGMNYRLRQFMPFLHSPGMLSFTTDPDNRITYQNTDSAFFTAAYGLVAIPRLGSPVLSIGSHPSLDLSDTGKLEHRWYGTVVAAPTGSETPNTIELVAGSSAEVPVPGFKLATVRLLSGSAGDTFELFLRQRPAVDIAELVPTLNSVMGPDIDTALFGQPPYAMPFRDFKAWSLLPHLQFQLAGVLFALAYRTDKIRRGA